MKNISLICAGEGLVLMSTIFVLCYAIIITMRTILSSVPELSNCPGSFRLLYFKERVEQRVDPHNLLPLHVPPGKGGGRCRCLNSTLHLTF